MKHDRDITYMFIMKSTISNKWLIFILPFETVNLITIKKKMIQLLHETLFVSERSINIEVYWAKYCRS